MRHARVAELADALDSKSSEVHTLCGFDSRLWHIIKTPIRLREAERIGVLHLADHVVSLCCAIALATNSRKSLIASAAARRSAVPSPAAWTRLTSVVWSGKRSNTAFTSSPSSSSSSAQTVLWRPSRRVRPLLRWRPAWRASCPCSCTPTRSRPVRSRQLAWALLLQTTL